MKLQLLSDLHLETEAFDPEPAPGAELLVLAGDIDSSWAALERFRGWPVPVTSSPATTSSTAATWTPRAPALRERCARSACACWSARASCITGATAAASACSARTRWCDFDLFGAARPRQGDARRRLLPAPDAGARATACRSTPAAVRARRWPAAPGSKRELAQPAGGWDATVVVTHFAPSLRSADPRYGTQPGTASFCNADDDLLPRRRPVAARPPALPARLPLPRAAGGVARVVCNARGLAAKGEPLGHDPLKLIEV